MPELTAIIIDDEPSAVRSLQHLLSRYCPEVNVVATTTDPQQAVELITTHQPQLLFLDIQMPHLDGFQLLEQLNESTFHVIFTTAHEDYAMQAIKAEALDYLLKPIGREDLRAAIDKALRAINEQHGQSVRISQLLRRIEADSKPNRISLPTGEGLEFVDVSTIRYGESDGSYTRLHFTDAPMLLISKPIGFLEDKLDGGTFFRIHHSYLVNINQVKRYLRGRGGQIVLKDGTVLPVSSRKKSDFLNAF
ncbi:MAG: LytR/AlgR family response regulator transcription factor [Lewinella sp.]